MENHFVEGPSKALSGMVGAYSLLPGDMKTRHCIVGSASVRQRLSQVLDIIQYLDRGHQISKLLTVVTDIHALGIGHMIHAMFDRDIISREAYSPQQVIQVIAENLESYEKKDCQVSKDVTESVIPGGDPGPTRCMVITALFQSGLIPRHLSLRHLRPVGSTPLISDVARLMEERTKLSFKGDICSKQRGTPIIKARFRTIWIMRNVCGFSLTMIGNSLGGRDHTTILNGLNKIMTERRNDRAILAETDLLCERADLIGVRNGLNRILTIESNRAAARLTVDPETRM